MVRSAEGVPFKIWINDQQTLYQGGDEGPAPFGIRGYQFEPVIKPDAFGASTVADRHT